METITCYKSNDGKVFEDKVECQIHESKNEFYNWFKDQNEDNELFSMDGAGIESEDMYDWIINNFDKIYDVYVKHRAIEESDSRVLEELKKKEFCHCQCCS